MSNFEFSKTIFTVEAVEIQEINKKISQILVNYNSISQVWHWLASRA